MYSQGVQHTTRRSCVCVWVCISVCVHARCCWTTPCPPHRVKINTNSQLEEEPVLCYRKRCSQRDINKSPEDFLKSYITIYLTRGNRGINVTCPASTVPLAQWQLGWAPAGKAVEIMDEWMASDRGNSLTTQLTRWNALRLLCSKSLFLWRPDSQPKHCRSLCCFNW